MRNLQKIQRSQDVIKSNALTREIYFSYAGVAFLDRFHNDNNFYFVLFFVLSFSLYIRKDGNIDIII
jgi:hypothetical protein